MLKKLGQLSTIFSILWMILGSAQAQPSIAISAVRVWPAQDYTRITIESNRAIQYKQFTIKNPDRLVIDLENVVIVDFAT